MSKVFCEDCTYKLLTPIGTVEQGSKCRAARMDFATRRDSESFQLCSSRNKMGDCAEFVKGTPFVVLENTTIPTDRIPGYKGKSTPKWKFWRK